MYTERNNVTTGEPACGELERKADHLRALLEGMGRVVVAFSGGVDSTLVLKAAVDALGREHVWAVTARSPSVPQTELDEAFALAESIGVEHVIVDTDEVNNPSYAANPVNRCYFCKTTLYERLHEAAAGRDSYVIVNGTNLDDLGDYRPGLEAAKEHRVRSPLVEARLTKADVRALSARLGLPTHDKPASPCLSSRVPYGESITPEKLRMIEDAERFLHELGFRECRVRHHGDLARIEVPADRVPELAAAALCRQVDARLKAIGYKSVSLDLRGLRSGSLNEALPAHVVQLRVS